MSPSRLLRVSAFCRERTSRKVIVRVEILRSIPRRRRRTPSRVVDPEASVYVSTDLLVALSVQVGDVSWLSCSSGSLKGVPVVLLVADECDGDTNEFVVRVPPTIAASIGTNYVNGCDSCCLETYDEELLEANVVKLRPLGRPVPKSWRDIPETVPDVVSTRKTRLLAQSSLITVWDDFRGLFIYEVVAIESHQQQNAEAAIATRKTKWTLEPVPLESSVRRLPPLAMAASFQNSIRSPQERESSGEDIRRKIPCIEAETPPHPSISEMTKALRIRANSPASQRILHVEGAEENHVGCCIESAANTLGMRYLCIRGLAAHAHASGIPVSTGSQADQLAGCKAALRHAQECAPCVLHLSDMDQEWSKEDEPLRQMQQQRLWTVLMDSLSVRADSGDDSGSFSSHAPSVTVVLSTTKPLSAGPLLQNLVFQSVVIEHPDETYARYLWNDDSSFDELYSSHLEGRLARGICHLQRYWRHCSSNSNKMEVFVAFCKQTDTKQQKSTPHIPSVHWQDVGGLANVRGEIMDAIELPLKHPKLFPNGGRSGILLYGTC